MPTNTISLVVAAIAANAFASILLKHAAIHAEITDSGLPPTKTLLVGSLALICYGVAFFVYAAVLKTLPVSKAYTLITFGAQTVLILAGALFFGERYGPMAWLGLVLVVVGLLLIARSAAT